MREIALGAWLLLTAATGGVAGGPVDVLISSDILGEAAAPTCCPRASGGVARRVQRIREFRARSKEAILLLDGGDMYFPRSGIVPGSEKAWSRRAELLADAAAATAYDAIALGESDLALGDVELGRLAARASSRTICANLKSKLQHTVLPYAIWEIGGITIGVTAVADVPALGSGPQFESAEAALRRIVPDLVRSVDVTIVLAHTGWSGAVRVANGIPGIDILVAGHSERHDARTESIGKTLVIDPGRHGHDLAHVRLQMGPRKAHAADRESHIRCTIESLLPDAPPAPDWDERVR